MTFRAVRFAVAVSILSLALPALAAAQAVTYTVTDLNTAPGTDSCVATALNDLGVAAGGCGLTAAGNANGAAIWRGGSMTALGKLPKGNYAWATAVNSLGAVVGDGDAGDWQPRPFITYKGSLLNMDPQGGANMRTVGVLDNGIVFGNYAKGLSGNTSAWSPVYWFEEKPGRYRRVDLPRVPGGDSKVNGASLTAINHIGQAVGWVQNSLFGQRGAFWNNDAAHAVVVLEAMPGDNQSIAWAVNDLGEAVGESHTAFVGRHAVRWNNDALHTPVDLGVLPGDVESHASYINNAGQVVGQSWNAVGQSHVFVYQNGVMTDVMALLDPAAGVTAISVAFGLNNSGQILAYGMKDGRMSSLLLTPSIQ